MDSDTRRSINTSCEQPHVSRINDVTSVHVKSNANETDQVVLEMAGTAQLNSGSKIRPPWKVAAEEWRP